MILLEAVMIRVKVPEAALLPMVLLCPAIALVVLFAEIFQLLLLLAVLLFEAREGGGNVGLLLGDRLALGETSREGIEAGQEGGLLGFEGFDGIFGAIGQAFVLVEFQHICEDFFAIARPPQHKLIGPPLAQIRRIHKGVVVQLQQLNDFFLGGSNPFFRDRAKIILMGLNLKLQLTTAAPGARSNHPIGHLTADKHKVNPHRWCAGLNHVIITTGAAFAPQHPSHRFEQRGFSRPIGPTNTGRM